jgi:hypothetical protein
MGGGNGQKSATARARAQAKAEKPKGACACSPQQLTATCRMLTCGMLPPSALLPVLLPAGSQIKANQSSLTMKCHVCLTQFVCTVRRAVSGAATLPGWDAAVYEHAHVS